MADLRTTNRQQNAHTNPQGRSLAEPETGLVLLADDDDLLLAAIHSGLTRHGALFQILTANSAAAAVQLFSANQPNVVVLDLELDPTFGPSSGLELLTELIIQDESTRFIILTGHGSDEYGIQALKRGAASFLQKPIDHRLLLTLIQDGINYSQLKRKSRDFEQALISTLPTIGLSSKTKAMQEILTEIKFAATTRQPVLILGETGTGKGVIAKAIHQLHTPGKPWVRAQPTFGNFDLVQSELFGHERGAFTGATNDRQGLLEEANGGTLFLDEIDALPEQTQVMLLETLQERTFRRVGSSKVLYSHFRLLAATNKPLPELKRRIREDLFHRISHLTITVPPLRERLEDLQTLVQELLQQIAAREKIKPLPISTAALQMLTRYNWPGNIRELSSVIEQAIFRARFNQKSVIDLADVTVGKVTVKAAGTFREQVNNFQLRLIKETLNHHQGNLSQAAKALGLDRVQFKRILKRLG